MPDPVLVRSMFSRIAGRYDLLNHTLSLGIDRGWRRRVVRAAQPLQGALAIDACSGTGDLALALRAAGARVLGVDFTHAMLRRARGKRGGGGLDFVQGDALRLPVAAAVADVATVAFGIRNVADPDQALREFLRVLKPGGRVLVLEFSTPRGRLFGAAYRQYFTRVLPRVGGWISGDREAYSYLPRSVGEWPGPDAFRAIMESAGFEACTWRALTGGVACLHEGRRPARASSARDLDSA
jgi:demethylmenaquinone methyltransferase/2-methoxy-6-polyprenyl-1,4-benzoquinol methylase